MDGRTGESLEVLPELALSLVCRASASPTSEAALVSPTVKQTAHHVHYCCFCIQFYSIYCNFLDYDKMKDDTLTN